MAHKADWKQRNNEPTMEGRRACAIYTSIEQPPTDTPPAAQPRPTNQKTPEKLTLPLLETVPRSPPSSSPTSWNMYWCYLPLRFHFNGFSGATWGGCNAMRNGSRMFFTSNVPAHQRSTMLRRRPHASTSPVGLRGRAYPTQPAPRQKIGKPLTH